MKFITIPDILRVCKQNDANTPFRKNNIIDFLNDNNIQYHKVGQRYLVNKEDFFKKINPNNITKQYPVPKIRTMQGSIDEYNNTHQDKINVHTIERIREYERIYCYKDIRLCLMNYTLLENEIEIEQYKKNFKFRPKIKNKRM